MILQILILTCSATKDRMGVLGMGSRHILQNAVEDIFLNSFGAVVDNTVDPLGEIVTIKLVPKEVKPKRLWIYPSLSSWLIACHWL